MISVIVNTTTIQTKLKLILDHNAKLLAILEEVAKKIGEPFLNPKCFTIYPINKYQYAGEQKLESKLNYC